MDNANVNKNNEIPAKTTRKYSCYVPECFNSSHDENISLHEFPSIDKHRSRRNKWFMALKMDKKHYKKTWRICNKHFLDNDFFPRYSQSQKRVLKCNAVPTQNIPGKNKCCRSRPLPSRKIQSPKQKSPKVCDLKTTSDKVQEIMEQDDILKAPENDIEIQIQNNDQDLPRTSLNNTTTAQFNKDVCIQVNTSNNNKFYEPTFIEKLKTNKDLFSWTGIPSFKTLRNIEACVRNIESAKQILNAIDVPVETLIVLTMVKIKVNLSFNQMKTIFNISRIIISQHFFKFLPILRAAIKSAVYWPSKDEITKNLPDCFVPDFKDCIAVCGCTEFAIETPKSRPSKLKCYSRDKDKYTVKMQITIAPHGQIIHVSNAYGGNASNKHILLKQKILDNFSESDAIMVDKGYDISKECFEKGITLYKSSFLCGEQLTLAESTRNSEIGSARVHVERSFQRIKLFKIFNSKFSTSLLKNIDDIMYIVCSIVNLSPPI